MMNGNEDQNEDIPSESTPISMGEQKRPLLTRKQRIERWFEVVTAVMLGVVTVATAWNGYQAARWGGVESTKYTQASALRVDATRDLTLAGQVRLYDLILVNSWIDAYTQGNTNLANIYESKFRPEFIPIFNAWLALDPFHNPHAPPGPLFMPQYKLSQEVQANQLDAEAATAFKDGQAAGEQSDEYILNIVFLATVLFLTAIAGRFEWNTVKAVILAIALGLLLFALYHLFTYPIT